MLARVMKFCTPVFLALGLVVFSFAVTWAQGSKPLASRNGTVMVKSAYGVGETIARLKKDISDKGIRFFLEIDQAKLATDAGISLRPSTLLIFGNPPLGPRSSSRRTRWPDSIGRSGSSSRGTRKASSGPPTRILPTSRADTRSRIAMPSSRWRRT